MQMRVAMRLRLRTCHRCASRCCHGCEEQHLDSLRRKDSLRGAETTEISVRLENYFASHFEGSAEDPAPPSKERRSETADLRLCACALLDRLRSLHDDAGCFRFGSFRFNHDFDILIERLEKAQYPINRVAPKATTDHVRYIGLLDPHQLGRC